jgi:hypothetical protein
MANQKSDNGMPAAAIAAGVAAAAGAAAAGYYFYGTKHAKKHRTAAAKWAGKMKNDVIREAKKVRALNEDVMHGVVDRVAAMYEARQIDPAELRAMTSELKKNWKKVRAETGGIAKKIAPAKKRAAKKKR